MTCWSSSTSESFSAPRFSVITFVKIIDISGIPRNSQVSLGLVELALPRIHGRERWVPCFILGFLSLVGNEDFRVNAFDIVAKEILLTPWSLPEHPLGLGRSLLDV